MPQALFCCPDCGELCDPQETYISAVDDTERCPECHDTHADAVARQDAAQEYARDLDIN